MALEGNKDIFDAILKPMKKSLVVTPTVALVVRASEDLETMPVVPRKFIRKVKFSKYVDNFPPFVLPLPQFKILTGCFLRGYKAEKLLQTQVSSPL